MTSKSKKLLKVIDGLRAWNLAATVSGSNQKSGIDVKEILKSDHFHLGMIARHGFPYQPSCMEFDPVQRILAVGTKNGCIKLFGRPGVEFHFEHPSSAAVLQLIFLVNEGGLISLCQDDVVHLWNIRQKPPDIVHSLHFKRETLTCGYLAVSSSWLSVGSEQGNVHFVNVQSFNTSGYVINWNRAINVTQSQRPGAVVQLAEHPQDSNRLLIGYSSGLLVLWDLRAKTAETRFQYHETLYSFAWHWEGKGFISAHSSGTIVTWTLNQPKRPQSVVCPHAGDDDVSNSQFSFEPIRFVQWLPTKTGESIIVFSGGNRRDCLDAVIDDDEGDCTTPSITIMRGKRLAVMQMDFSVVTFTTLCTSPYFNETCDPYAVAVLLQQDLVLVDLLTPGYPSFENPYPMDIAVSPVTSCYYVVDCPSDLVPAFYAVGSRGKRALATSKSENQEGTAEGQMSVTSNDSFSSKKWPIDGGEWGTNLCSYQELIITGHADGSVRFWDASGVNLSPLYKVRTSRYFDRSVMLPTNSPPSRGDNFASYTTFDQSSCTTPDQLYANAVVEPLAIRHIRFCVESRTLLLAGQRHLCLLSFCRSQSAFEIPVLDIYLQYEEDQAVEPSIGTVDETSSLMSSSSGRRGASQVPTNSTSHSTSPVQVHTEREVKVSVIVRSGIREWSAGYQPSLICRLAAPNLTLLPSEVGMTMYTANPSPISAIALTSATNLFAFGTDGGIAVVDYYQGICLVCAAVPELEALDPLARSRIRSSSRLANSGNGSKTTAAVSITTSAGTNTNQSPSPTLSKQKAAILLQPPPPLVRKTTSSSHSFRFPWRHRTTLTSFRHPHRETYRLTGRRFSSIANLVDSALPQSARNQGIIEHRNAKFRRHRVFQKPRRMSTLPQASTLCVIDFRGTDKSKPKITSEASPGLIMASSPLLASMMFPQMEPSKGESNPLPSALSDKYGDTASQRQSDTSEQSSIDQSVLEGIRTLAFVDMSDRKNEPSLWIGTNRGSVFGFTLDTSEDSNSHSPGYSLLGSLFKFDGEVVYVGFGNSQGEMCTAPSVKWDAGSSAVPRLTLVPNLEESGGSAELESSEGVFNEFGFVASESAAFRRLGHHASNSPMSSKHAGSKWKSNGPPSTPLPSSSTHSGNQGMSGTATSQEETLSSSGSNQSSLDTADGYFMVVISEKHAQVIGLPSRNCYNRVKITETSSVIRAEMSNQRMPFSTSISASQLPTTTPTTVLYISCLLSNGHLIAFSLPSLRILSDVEVVSKPFHQALFTFGNLGHSIYMSSPSELAKISMSADLSNNLSEMHGELFLPCNMPEPPKRNFFTNLFTGNGLSSADKDALFGEKQAGKSTCGTAALLPSGRMDRLTGQAGGATSEIARARNAALERGEKLGHLDMQTQEMVDQSKNLSKTAAMLAAKYEKQDKWWGVWPR